MSALKYWLWLTELPGLTNQTRLALLRHFPTPEDVYYADPEEVLLTEGITREQAKLLEDKDCAGADRILADCQRLDLDLLTIQDLSLIHIWMKMTDRMLNLTGSSASIPAPRPKFLNSCQTQFSRIMPTASATKTLYIVSAAGKYRRNTAISQPSAPKTEVVTRSRPAITCSAIHSTMPSRIPIAYASFQWVYCGGHQPVH